MDAKAALDAKNRSGRGTRVEISGSTGFVEAPKSKGLLLYTVFLGLPTLRLMKLEVELFGEPTLHLWYFHSLWPGRSAGAEWKQVVAFFWD